MILHGMQRAATRVSGWKYPIGMANGLYFNVMLPGNLL